MNVLYFNKSVQFLLLVEPKLHLWLNVFLNETIPKRTQHRASLPPWISQSTFHLIKCLKTARRTYKYMHPKVLKLK